MSKRSSPVIIGSFIIGSVVLIIVGLIIFGSRNLSNNELKYILNFEGSVKGLDKGAPVVFRGVKVGEVSKIQLVINSGGESIKIPVTINLDPLTLTQIDSDNETNFYSTARAYINQMTKNGLKAGLKMQSLITGKLLIELEFDRNDSNDETVFKDGEIPTKQSIITILTKRIEQLHLEEFPIEEVLHNGVKAIQAIERILNSPDLKGTISGLDKTLNEVHVLVNNLNVKLLPEVHDLVQSINTKVIPLIDDKIVPLLDTKVSPLIDDLQKTMVTSRSLAEDAGTTLKAIGNIASEDSDLHYQLINTFKELSSAARSIRVMTDYLHQHPESFFYGKGNN